MFRFEATTQPMRMPGHCSPLSEKGVRLAQNTRVGPCILVGIKLEKAEVGLTSGPTRRLSHFGARAGDKDVRGLDVLDVLQPAHGAGVEPLVRLVEQDAVLGLLRHGDELLQLRAGARVA